MHVLSVYDAQLCGSCLMLPFMIVVCMVNYGGLCKAWYECCVIHEVGGGILDYYTNKVPKSACGSHGEVVYLYLEF